MTTPRQIAANRETARKSTGPRTPHGKAIVSQNAIRHGLYASAPVIPGVESNAARERHRQTAVASLAPVGQVEDELVERVALILWRLKRVNRYERDVTSSARRRSFEDLNREYVRPVTLDDPHDFCAPEVGPDDVAWIDMPDWTAERLMRLVAAIAQEVGRHPEQLR